MASKTETPDEKLDLSARAAWHYYIGGKTQDEIATMLNISRPAAQRLVALAVTEKLIKFRLDYPIAECMECRSALVDRYDLAFCDVVPSDAKDPSSNSGIAISAANYLDSHIARKATTVIGVATGRTLRATVNYVSPVERRQHKIISRVGNMARDGSASAFDVVMRLADKIGGQRYPMPTPVVADTIKERKLFQTQRSFKVIKKLAAEARVTLVGLAWLDKRAPMYVDGFLNDKELKDLVAKGAVGEIAGWAFDRKGRLVENTVNDRVVSVPLAQPARQLTIAVACGTRKVTAIRAALEGQLISGLITDDATAKAVLAPP